MSAGCLNSPHPQIERLPEAKAKAEAEARAKAEARAAKAESELERLRAEVARLRGSEQSE